MTKPSPFLFVFISQYGNDQVKRRELRDELSFLPSFFYRSGHYHAQLFDSLSLLLEDDG